MYNFKKVKIIELTKRSGTYGEVSELKVVDSETNSPSIIKVMGKYKLGEILFIPVSEHDL